MKAYKATNDVTTYIFNAEDEISAFDKASQFFDSAVFSEKPMNKITRHFNSGKPGKTIWELKENTNAND